MERRPNDDNLDELRCVTITITPKGAFGTGFGMSEASPDISMVDHENNELFLESLIFLQLPQPS
ncbi:hypothetical protein SDJN02_09181, partial [Cucurbita argyrosperma subsp. argyrosperma]